MNVGKVVQVIGPTVDVAFDPEKLPKLLNAITIEDPDDFRFARSVDGLQRSPDELGNTGKPFRWLRIETRLPPEASNVAPTA